MKIYDFKCPIGHVFEALVQDGALSQKCDCGHDATRIISGGHFNLPGHDAAYPTAHTRWVREHERAGNKESP